MNILTMPAMRDRVQAGVDLLDRQMPDWWSKIDLDTLDMFWPEHCILGQACGGYYNGLVRLADTDASDHWAWQHGFWLDCDEIEAYPRLRAMWSGIVRGRRLTWGH